MASSLESLSEITDALVYVERSGGGYGGWKVELLGERELSKSEEKLLLCVECRGLLREANLLEREGKHELRCSVCLPQREKLSVLTAGINREAISEREVNCPLEKCTWTGEIEKLRHHLEDECPLLHIPCPLGCAPLSGEGKWGVNRIERKLVETHMRNECPMRMIRCEFCEREVKACQMNAHLEECEEYLLPCPNACEDERKEWKGRNLVSHLGMCPLQKVECPYSEFGCEMKMQRTLLRHHEDFSIHSHLKLSLEGMKSKIEYLEKSNQEKENEILLLKEENKEIKSRLTPLKGGLIWKLRGINKKMKKCKSDYSDSLYIGLYKFQMYTTWEHNSLGCYLRIMKGAWDDSLCWPVYCRYTFILHSHDDLCLDKVARSCEADGSNSCFVHKYFKKPLALPFTSHGYPDFISVTDLMSGRYIQDDEITVETIIELVTASNESPFALSPSVSSPQSFEKMLALKSGRIQWKIEGVKQSVEDGDIILSSAFYASCYKVQCEVRLNDRDSGYVACYIRILKGEWDEYLVWPFKGKYTFTLINQEKEDRNYSKYSLTENVEQPDQYFSKPLTDTNIGWGKQTFIQNSKLLGKKYLQNDTITLSVCVEVIL